MSLGARIKAARDAAGMTQADLAYALRAYPMLDKMSPPRISEWETNRVPRLGFYAIEAVADVTRVPLECFSAYEPSAAQNGAEPPARELASSDAIAMRQAGIEQDRRANGAPRRRQPATPRP